MDPRLEYVADRMRKTSEEITRLLGDVASEQSTTAHTVGNDVDGLRSEIEHLNAALEREKAFRATAERNMERFRYALWVYLQERDGHAGVSAPTPETLKLIRELIKELE